MLLIWIWLSIWHLRLSYKLSLLLHCGRLDMRAARTTERGVWLSSHSIVGLEGRDHGSTALWRVGERSVTGIWRVVAYLGVEALVVVIATASTSIWWVASVHVGVRVVVVAVRRLGRFTSQVLGLRNRIRLRGHRDRT
jgi:hypothetical protein